ncbi:peptide-binding transporter [Streptomyces sp. SPB074]|nr:peptide-binding transporter [Streptomyces sp. SPB074]
MFRRRNLFVRLVVLGHHQLRAARELHAELDSLGRHRLAPQHEQLVHIPVPVGTARRVRRLHGQGRLAQGQLARHRREVRRRQQERDDHPRRPALERREAVTSRDVEFWYNLVKADKEDWASYSPGKAPDNWTSFKTVDDTHFTLTFDKAYNQQWMLANELSMIRPMPQHVWDKTSDAGTVSDQDRDTAGAKKVWSYLNGAAKKISGYASDPLWKTVSGPNTIKTFTTAGKVQLAANPKYDGGGKANIKNVNLLPFTTTDAEVNALRSGTGDHVHAIQLQQPVPGTGVQAAVRPPGDPDVRGPGEPVQGRLQRHRRPDLRARPAGPDLDVRLPGAEEQLVPLRHRQGEEAPHRPRLDRAGRHPRLHGPRHGPGPVRQGRRQGHQVPDAGPLAAGSTVTDNMTSALQSSFAKTGIKFDIKTAPVNSVLSLAGQCKPGDSSCKWQLSFFGSAGSWYFPAYPSGDSLFATGGGSNFGSYSNPAVDKLVTATTTSSSDEAVQKYSAALAKDLPVIWLPEPDYQISVVKSGPGGFAQDSLANFHPAMWKWTK